VLLAGWETRRGRDRVDEEVARGYDITRQLPPNADWTLRQAPLELSHPCDQ